MKAVDWLILTAAMAFVFLVMLTIINDNRRNWPMVENNFELSSEQRQLARSCMGARGTVTSIERQGATVLAITCRFDGDLDSGPRP